ncbi:MAG: phage baseplate assembly protein V [Lachnospiraceae bacterium]|nr:phage baseplate assembly protein V [Lachnospiraceae bacterium]
MNFYDELLSKNKEAEPSGSVNAPGLFSAIVKDIWEEKHPGMVKVEYLMGEKAQKTSDWVRVMTPYGGKEFGNYWLPEINTEVIVGFINGNLNTPVVLGCLWNDTDTFPKDTVTEKNEIKRIMTKAGTTILFTDTEGKEKITIRTPKETEICIDDETESIVLQDKDKNNSILMDVKGGNVTVTAKTAVTLAVGSKEVIRADSNSVKIAAGTVEVEGTQSLKLKGQSSEFGGTSVKVKASGELGLEASGMAQLKGSMVKIN